MSKWVRLPEGAQVTMSREEYESTQGISLRDKVIIAAVIIFIVFALGKCHASSGKPEHRVTPTHTPTSVATCGFGHCP